MKKLYLNILFLSVCTILSAQDIYILFHPKSSGLTIDSALVTNQRTNQQVILAENELLLLSQTGTGIRSSENEYETAVLYPNPCFGDAVLSFSIQKKQNVTLSIYNISGQVTSLKKQELSPGRHSFSLKFPVLGVYVVTVLKEDGQLSFKAIYSGIQQQKCRIDYTGSEIPMMMKSATGGKGMIYNRGDILLCSAFSGKNNTIVTDSPIASKAYSVEFQECIDPDNHGYPIVKIGNNWWMAGNLRTTKYRDGGEITLVSDNSAWAALKTGAFSWNNNDGSFDNKPYGALYNWHAVNTGNLCPAGWHVPSDNEWKKLEKDLGMSQDQTDAERWRGTDQGTRMKTTAGWYNNGNGTNSNGFSALPGGYRYYYGLFETTGMYGYWWTSTSYQVPYAWYRLLHSELSKVSRGTDYKESGFSIRCIRDTLSITTSIPASITATSALLGGNIASDGGEDITERGICYSTSPNPTISGNKIAIGNGTGLFSQTVTGLGIYTTYFVRAYASSADRTAYGEQESFTTQGNPTGTLTDNRDGKIYKTVKIGDQWWMAENLAWLPVVFPSATGSKIEKYYYVYGYNGTNVEEAKTTVNFNTYGVLYNWPAAMFGSLSSDANPSGVRGVCPAGWHLPGDAEWKQLEIQLGMTQGQADATGYRGTNQGAQMKNNTGWYNNGNGPNLSGFTGVPGGARFYTGSFENILKLGCWWSSSESNNVTAWGRDLDYQGNYVYRKNFDKDYGFSIRCVKGTISSPLVSTFNPDSVTSSSAILGGNITYDGPDLVTERGVCYGQTQTPTVEGNKMIYGNGIDAFRMKVKGLTSGTAYYARAYAITIQGIVYGNEVGFKTLSNTVTDVDGNTYRTVKIGTQWWMAENLKTTRYRDSTSIPLVIGNSAFKALTTGAFCWYNNDQGNKDILGGLYNWYAVNTGKLCPAGWHIPTNEEWINLIDYLGGEYIAGGKLKEKGTTHWLSPNTSATDETGFTALPAGARSGNEFNFYVLHYYGIFWSSSEATDPAIGISRVLAWDVSNFRIGYDFKYDGFSVRCIKDNENSTGSFSDSRDGKVYKTVKIGDQLWMAENLAYLPSVNSPTQGSTSTKCYYVYGYSGTNISEAKANPNYSTYGVLYNWQAAMNGAPGSNANPSGIQGVCPAGWHLPSDAEWTTIENHLIINGYNWDGTSSGNKIAKSMASITNWTRADNSVQGDPNYEPEKNNKSGFNGFPGGARGNNGQFTNMGFDADWWSSSDYSNIYAWRRFLFAGYENLYRDNICPKDYGFYVRCVKD